MSTGARPGYLSPARSRPREARATTWPGAVRVMGFAALAACVIASARIALGADSGGYLLELTGHAAPRWIQGPLHGLAYLVGPIGPNGLSAALIFLCGGYALALLCARWLSLRASIAAVVLANLAFTLGPTIVSTDVFGYIAYAREIAVHGLDPYVVPPIALAGDHILEFVYWKHQPSPYGPLFSALSAPLGLLSPSAALWIFKAATGLASIAVAAIVADLAGRRGLNRSRAAIFVGLNPIVLFYAVSGAHNDLLAVLLVVCGLALTLRGMEASGASVALGAAAIKLTLGLALPFVVILAARRRRAALGVVLALLALGIPSLLIFGPHLFDQLHRITTDSLFDTTFSGPDRLATLLGTHISDAMRLICTGAAGVAALVAIICALRGADAVSCAGWACLALLASIASLAPWYLVWLLPLAALGRSRGLRTATLLATAYLVVVHLPAVGGEPWLSHAGSSGASLTQVASTGATGSEVLPRQLSASTLQGITRLPL
jgi:hypothetical protein